MEGVADQDLMVMGARGRHKRVLLPGGGRNFIEDVAWGPRAGRVALAMDRLDGSSNDVWIYTLATRKLSRLHVGHHPDRYIRSVDWSRDGTIVFAAMNFAEDEDSDLYAVRPDGSGLRQLTDTPNRSEEGPRVAPGGRRLVYTAYVNTGARCRFAVVSQSDGTNPRRVGAGCNVWGASWSPNSLRLLVQTLNGRKLRDEIWAMTVDGSSKRFIVAGTDASWRPR